MSDSPMERLSELLMSEQPVDMNDAAKRVATFLIHELAEWSSTYATFNSKCLEQTGGPITPADPIFAGLILTMIHLIMEPANEEAVGLVGQHLSIPPECRGGVRRKINRLMDSLQLKDDSHLLN
jgi:hypothetical protein